MGKLKRITVYRKDAVTGKTLSFKAGKSYLATFGIPEIKRFSVYFEDEIDRIDGKGYIDIDEDLWKEFKAKEIDYLCIEI